jgi:hypothetical protein
MFIYYIFILHFFLYRKKSSCIDIISYFSFFISSHLNTKKTCVFEKNNLHLHMIIFFPLNFFFFFTKVFKNNYEADISTLYYHHYYSIIFIFFFMTSNSFIHSNLFKKVVFFLAKLSPILYFN